jgi:hypothetical protein
MVLCYDRKTGKLLWERVARIATDARGDLKTQGGEDVG